MTQPRTTPPRFHLVGVGGVGMSALAELLLRRGCTVSGSDRFEDQGRRLPAVDALCAIGLRLVPQDGSGLTDEVDTVVLSGAVEADNPDRRAAEARGLRLLSRAACLAEQMGTHRCLAVAGTAGKSTVTAMIGWILEACGRSPTVVNGAPLLDWMKPHRTGAVRAGTGDWFVLEADESDRSLFSFSPDLCVVTNISADHFSREEVTEIFRRFSASARGGVLCGPGVASQLALPDDREARCREISLEPLEGERGFLFEGERCVLQVPGEHNLENAALAAAAGRAVGLEPPEIAAALALFRGVYRRLQTLGESGGVRVIDDYAHNPAKIRAAWRAVAEDSNRVLGVWRPHGYRPLEAMFDDLVETWAEVCRPDDRLFLLPVFYAGGTVEARVDSALLAEQLCARGLSVDFVESYEALDRLLSEAIRPGDAVLIMGARDPELPVYAKGLAKRLATCCYQGGIQTQQEAPHARKKHRAVE